MHHKMKEEERKQLFYKNHYEAVERIFIQEVYKAQAAQQQPPARIQIDPPPFKPSPPTVLATYIGTKLSGTALAWYKPFCESFCHQYNTAVPTMNGNVVVKTLDQVQLEMEGAFWIEFKKQMSESLTPMEKLQRLLCCKQRPDELIKNYSSH